MALRHATLLAFVFFCLAGAGASRGRPNIVLIVADDLGWNDVSFHGSNQIPTPNIDALAYTGIILNSHYVPALCTPSRASLLSGKYPTTMGMQHLVILAPEPWGLPLEETLMPEYFKRHGYSTHAVGKWHLGFYDKRYTPTYRGFDTHFGYWNGYQDYYDHTMEDHTLEGAPGPLKGYDMRRGLEIDYKSRGEYSTDAFTNEAVDIIKNHNSSQGPLFLYLAHLSPHSGNPDKPFQAPDDEIAKHSDIKDPERRVYAAMVTKLDEGVGKVVSALKESNLLDNSIILFMSDNGAVTFGVHSNRGSNFPLRGLKESPWEGGVRGVAALWSPLLNRTRRVSSQLMHVSDWLPTLYSAAGLDTAELGEIDGMNLWDALSQDGESPRTEVFNNYDEIEGYSSLRVGPWKYVEGTAQGGEVDLWYGESGKDFSYKGYDEENVFHSKAGMAIMDHFREKQLENSDSSKEASSFPFPSREEVLKLRRESTITCNEAPFKLDELKNHSSTEAIIELKRRLLRDLESIRYKNLVALSAAAIPEVFKELNDARDFDEIFGCDPLKTTCLFNLDEDPCERINLAKLFPGVVEDVKNRLKNLIKGVRKPGNVPGDPFSDPALHNGTWTNWRNEDGVAMSREYEEATKLFLNSILERDLILILSDNFIFKIVSSPISFLFNHLFIKNNRELASALSFVIIIAFFAAVYNMMKRSVPLGEMDGNAVKEFSIDEISRTKIKNKWVKR